ncbi:uncharacterized protein LOC144440280 isoform X1 [Glandiceps talaboti]
MEDFSSEPRKCLTLQITRGDSKASESDNYSVSVDSTSPSTLKASVQVKHSGGEGKYFLLIDVTYYDIVRRRCNFEVYQTATTVTGSIEHTMLMSTSSDDESAGTTAKEGLLPEASGKLGGTSASGKHPWPDTSTRSNDFTKDLQKYEEFNDALETENEGDKFGIYFLVLIGVIIFLVFAVVALIVLLLKLRKRQLDFQRNMSVDSNTVRLRDQRTSSVLGKNRQSNEQAV